jgi:hypothetical protein
MPEHIHIKFRHAFPHGLPFRIRERSFIILQRPKMTCLLCRRCLAARSCGGLKLEARVNATGPGPQTSTTTRTISIKQQHFLVQKSPRSTASRYVGSAYILLRFVEICGILKVLLMLDSWKGLQASSQPLKIQVGSLRITESKAAKFEAERFST